MKRTNVLWITGLVLGWFFDFLFWKSGQGINFAIYVALCLAGGFLVLSLNNLKPSWKSPVLLIPILFFASMSFIRLEPLTQFLSFALTLGLMSLLAVTFLGGRWPWYSLSDYVANIVRLVGSMIARPFMFRSARQKEAAAAGPVEAGVAASRFGWKRFWAIFRGLLIALPIVILFATLLSSADLVFAQRIQDFTKLFRLEKFPEYIFRLTYILISAYALMGVFLHAAQKSQDEKLVGMEKPLVSPFLGFTEAAVILGAVVLLFAVFVGIQFRYFFGGQTNIGIQGYTFSEYARQGFGELVTVAFFSLLLFLGLSAIVNRQTPTQRWTFSGLGIGMVVLVGVILDSAFQRLLLYEAAYGFSRLRMYTHIFMVWLGVLLAAVVVLDILRKERLFAMAALLASIGFAATLAIANVDGTIVRQNVSRAASGGALDVAYITSLSPDSVPALADSLLDGRLTPAVRNGIGAVLVCRRNADQTDTDWRAFSLSRWSANRSLQQTQVREILDNYRILDNEWPVQVQTPLGEKYDCSSLGGMD